MKSAQVRGKIIRHRPARRHGRPGMALVIVMVVVMLVSLAAYAFNQQMTDAYRLASLQAEQTEARLTFSSGVEFGLAVAQLPRAERNAWLSSGPQRFDHISLESSPAESGIEDIAQWTFSLVKPATQSVGKSRAEPGWVDESSKLNALTLLSWDKQFPGHAHAALLNLPGATPETVGSFLAQLNPAISDRDSLAERLVDRNQQVQPRQQLAQLWTGGDWDHNDVVDPLEQALSSGTASSGTASSGTGANASGSEAEFRGPAWRDLLTFHSGCRNSNRLGQARVYLNDDNLSRLHSRLRAVWDDQRATFVIAARQYGLLSATSSDLAPSDFAPPESAWTPDFNVAASIRLTSPLDLIDTRVRIPQTGGQPIILVSPFAASQPMFEDYLGGLMDDVTLDPSAVIDGQININTAPPEVLLGIPEITIETVERIVSKRIVDGGTISNRDTLAWLVTEQVIEIETLKPLLPWMTAGGDCFSTQVIAHRDTMSLSFRGTVIFDARRVPAIASQLQLWHPWSPLRFEASGFEASQSNLVGHATQNLKTR